MEITQFIELLRKNNLKVTPQRIEIYKSLITRSDHPTAEMIHQKVRKNHPVIGLATIYKTIETFKQLGLVKEIGLGENGIRFEINQSPHVNVVCPICKRINDYESKSVIEFLSKLKAELGQDIVSQQFNVYIKCEKCIQNQFQ